jgi:predicted dehydrogenase
MKKLNVGVVGCGAISDIYIENGMKFRGCEIAACSDIVMERAVEKAARYGIPKAYSYGEMLADGDIDIVLNLTVHEAHYPLSMAALRAGKHIYNEKPLAAAFREGVEIMRLAGEKGLYVGCAPDTILGARTQTIRKLIDDGKIGFAVGAVAYMANHGHECWHANPFFIYEPGGGPIFDMGPYYLTTLVYLLGPVKQLSGMVSTPFAERLITSPHLNGQKIKVRVPTHINGMLEFENGAIANIIFTYDVWDSHLPRMEIFGSEGTVSVCDPDPLAGPDIFGGEIEYRRMDDSDWMGPPVSIPRKAPTKWERVEAVYGYRENSRGVGVAEMADAINSGRPNRASGDMALHVLEIAHGVHEAAKGGRHYQMTTTFTRPDALPPGLEEFSDRF